MKCVLVLVLGVLWACTAATPSGEYYGTGTRKYKVSDKQFLQHQKDILRLFKYLYQPSYYKDFQETASTYSIENNIDAYLNSTVVKNFLTYYKAGLLPKGEIFSPFYEEHLKQAISLFYVFYNARDFDTFYKTAVWARQYVNEGIFVYSFSVALTHRDDTFDFILPPIYEIYPYFFFNSDVIQKAQNYKQYYYDKDSKTYLIYSNYSGHYLNLHPEQSLSYYLEDIGYNSFYYYAHIYYPWWLDGEQFKLKNDRRGDQFYYLYQQLLARYYLERLCNDFGEIEFFDWEEPFNNGYYPSLRYPNGLEFPSRPNFALFKEQYYNYGQSQKVFNRYWYRYTNVVNYERRIKDAIDTGYVFTRNGKLVDLFGSDGIEVLGSILEGNRDSVNPRFYGGYIYDALPLLGYSYQPLDKYKVAPSALEHYETAVRDPAFYQFYKRVFLLFQKYKFYLPSYSYNELNYPGVKVEKVDFDKLITYFDYFDSDLSNAVYVTQDEFQNEPFKIKVRQQRLNHKPFSYRIQVNAEQPTDAVVRVYLGPKYDEYGRPINIDTNRVNFVEFETFKYKLQKGKNVIERSSRQFFWYVPDRTTYKELYKRIMGAVDNSETLQLDASEAFYGFPNRLLLPIGKPKGQVFQVYVIVNPYVAPSGRQPPIKDYYFYKVGTGYNYIDNYAFGFPFDRKIDENEFFVPNSLFTDVTIYHKQEDDLNVSTLENEP